MPSPENIRAKILDLVRQYHQAKFAPKAFDPDKDLVHYAGRVFWRTEQVNLVNNVPQDAGRLLFSSFAIFWGDFRVSTC